MKESHYNMYMKNVETLDTTTGHHCAAASITTKKRNLKVDLGKCVQMYKGPIPIFAWCPQFTKSAPGGLVEFVASNTRVK